MKNTTKEAPTSGLLAPDEVEQIIISQENMVIRHFKLKPGYFVIFEEEQALPTIEDPDAKPFWDKLLIGELNNNRDRNNAKKLLTNPDAIFVANIKTEHHRKLAKSID